MNSEISAVSYRVLNFILKYKRASGGVSPSIKEIGTGCHLNSTSQVYSHLMTLQQLGLIERNSHKARSIRLIGEHWSPCLEDPDA